MGYPGIWSASAIIGLDVRSTSQLWPLYAGSVLVSLSTSLIDDVLDEPDEGSSAKVVAAYLLIFQALDSDNKCQAGQEMFQGVKNGIAGFIGAQRLNAAGT